MIKARYSQELMRIAEAKIHRRYMFSRDLKQKKIVLDFFLFNVKGVKQL